MFIRKTAREEKEVQRENAMTRREKNLVNMSSELAAGHLTSLFQLLHRCLAGHKMRSIPKVQHTVTFLISMP